MRWHMNLRLAVLSAAAMLVSSAATAAAYRWEEITLPAASGATCGNGTPYRFYVNRAPAPNDRNLLIAYEFGGACTDYGSCTGEGGAISAKNPDGIPAGYLWSIPAQGWLNQIASPVMSAVTGNIGWLAGSSDGKLPPTANWTKVFLPYCTGDVHAGSAIRNYVSTDGARTLLQHFAGLANTRAALAWMQSNGLGQPDKMLSWGLSAGGYGAMANYAFLRSALQPRQSALLDDGGPLFPVNLDGDGSDSYAYRMYSVAFRDWGMLDTDGLLDRLRRDTPVGGSGANLRALGQLYGALARAFPQDRLGLSDTLHDATIARFSYAGRYPEVDALPTAQRDAMRMAMFEHDSQALITTLRGQSPNLGYFFPWDHYGIASNHTATAVTFLGTEIDSTGINVGAFVTDLVSGDDPAQRPVMQMSATQPPPPSLAAAIAEQIKTIVETVRQFVGGGS